MNYTNRINRLTIEISEIEYKIAHAVSLNKPAYALRLSKILEKQKEKLERWKSI